MSESKVPFIPRGGEQIYQQPFAAKGVDYYGFVLDADVQTLQRELCDKYLNTPAQGSLDFAPFGPWCTLVFNRLDSLASTQPPDDQKGWFSEQESAIWVLLEERKSGELYWFLPYIFVDNSYALCMGRETYGFPKSLGTFDLPSTPDRADYFGLQTEVVPTFTPHTKGIWQPLWSAVMTSDSGGPPSIFQEAGELLGAAAEEIRRIENSGDWHKFLELLKDLLEGGMPMVFLKQFPSVEDPNRACYQAIVEAPIEMTRFHTGCLLGGQYQVNIQDFASHPVRSDLGLAEALTPRLSFYAKFDFIIGNGKTLWQAP